MLIFWIISGFMIEKIFGLYRNPFMNELTTTRQCLFVCREKTLPELFDHYNVQNEVKKKSDNMKLQLCRSGCELFDMRYGGGLNVNPALSHCQLECKLTFHNKYEVSMCQEGCERMASKFQNKIQKMLVMTPQERAREADSLHADIQSEISEIDMFEPDLTDPSFGSQLEVGFYVDFKIPETHKRTMPIEAKDQPKNILTKQKSTGDWLDCASKNSGIPKWVLLSTMLGAIIVAIWLTLSMESRRSHEEECDDELVEISEEKNPENFIIEKETALLEKDTFKVTSGDDVKFVPPPTYLEVHKIHDSELPNYAEAVEIQNREETV